MEERQINIAVTIFRSSNDSKDTHRTKWFKQIWSEVNERVCVGSMFADPFARNCEIAGEFTNDLNPDTLAHHNLCGLEFLKTLGTNSFDGVIFDPPFSDRMATDNYDGFGVNLYSSHQKLLADMMKESARILRTGGFVLKFGFNCNRPHPNLDLVKVWIVNKGGYRNDTIVSLWVNNNYTLHEWGVEGPNTFQERN
jgi:hypothetical protein